MQELVGIVAACLNQRYHAGCAVRSLKGWVLKADCLALVDYLDLCELCHTSLCVDAYKT